MCIYIQQYFIYISVTSVKKYAKQTLHGHFYYFLNLCIMRQEISLKLYFSNSHIPLLMLSSSFFPNRMFHSHTLQGRLFLLINRVYDKRCLVATVSVISSPITYYLVTLTLRMFQHYLSSPSSPNL